MCSKLYILSSRIFADFYSFSIYFPVLRFDFRVYLKSENPFPMGPGCQYQCRPMSLPDWRSGAVVSGHRVWV
jgi:hypothetical protein